MARRLIQQVAYCVVILLCGFLLFFPFFQKKGEEGGAVSNPPFHLLFTQDSLKLDMVSLEDQIDNAFVKCSAQSNPIIDKTLSAVSIIGQVQALGRKSQYGVKIYTTISVRKEYFDNRPLIRTKIFRSNKPF